ncbi:Type IV secretory pathway, VirD4 component, TraG/TraD family ATPase (plasmid) [Carboxydocella thermautotrophica]|nr:Type IV secretory pathway, VirD4 component, TraG/TraD family ATPase [Carboxydocella thermautotrophica]
MNYGYKKDRDVTSRFYLALLIAAATVAALPAIIVGLVYSNVTRRLNLKIRVHAAVVIGLGLLAVIIHKSFIGYFDSIKALIKYQTYADFDWLSMLLLGLVIGPVLGAGLEIWYQTRPAWVKQKEPEREVDFRGPRYERVLTKLTSTAHPEDGVLLGVNEQAKPVVITDEEFNSGGLILGATGGGKTTTINNIIESCCQRGIPVIFVDGKGSKKQAARCMKLAQKYGRKFYYFSMTGQSHNYNPMVNGDPTELKDKLISISEWTEPHYKAICERYLQTAFQIFREVGHKVDVVNVTEWLTPTALSALLKKLPEQKQERYAAIIDELDEKGVKGLINRLAIFAESDIGHKLTSKSPVVIDLYKAISEHAVVVMSMDSLRFSEFSRALGKMIVNDLKTVASRMLEENKKVYNILDEFGVFAGPQVTDLINKSREAGFHNILSTQELADLRVNGSTVLMEQVFGNTNVKIIHRQDVPDSAAFIAESAGTVDSYTATMQVDGVRETGVGTVKKDKSFVVHPDKIKRLSTGRAILIKKTPEFSVVNIRVRWVEI